jgi:hypothetical protein
VVVVTVDRTQSKTRADLISNDLAAHSAVQWWYAADTLMSSPLCKQPVSQALPSSQSLTVKLFKVLFKVL